MNEETELKAVEMVRRIRDELAEKLRGMSDADIIAYFRKAGRPTKKSSRRAARPANRRMQPPARKARRG